MGGPIGSRAARRARGDEWGSAGLADGLGLAHGAGEDGDVVAEGELRGADGDGWRHKERFVASREYAERTFPDLRTVPTEAGHAPNLATPEAFNAAVLAFFADHPPA